MNRHSLIFHISLFFILLLVLINGLFYYQKRLEDHNAKEMIVKRFHEADRLLHERRRGLPPPHERGEVLKAEMNMYFEEDIEKIYASKLIYENHAFDIYQDKEHFYYLHHNRRHDIEMALRYKNEIPQQVNPWVFAMMINVLLFLFYFYILKKLRPLQTLKTKIVSFSNGKLDIDDPKKGKDEISEVSNEFNNAIRKIKNLQDSRNLFLRNIMHELNTPITKGKLITDLMREEKQKERLKRVFSRFEYLLTEFTNIERITSNAIVLDIKHYRAIDILNNAIDLLLLENANQLITVQTNSSLEIEADYAYFSIAMKNLLDNAIKYGQESTTVTIEDHSIGIESIGDELKNLSLNTMFNRTFESSKNGLGLGLYITQNIVTKHGYTLYYEHDHGKNKFIIDFS